MTDEQKSQLADLVANMKRVAQYGEYDGFAFDGRPNNSRMQRYLARCHEVVGFDDFIVSLQFTRDRGMHSSGWWKNPDYEQCLHLSLAFYDAESLHEMPQQHDIAKQIARLFFDGAERLIWIEPPFSDHGKRLDVHHYRLFTSPDFKVPILPRGEVYSRQFTEKGWKSWSDVHAEPQETAHT